MTQFQRLTPFKRCVLQNFPFIEEDFDALTNYALLCKVVEYLNNVIKVQNDVSGQVEELTTAFNNLKDYVDNYFKNLDVQEEINNKLDEMTEAGTIADIIAGYIQLRGILAYDTVASMKSATNLVNGSLAETYGFYTKGDGGSAKYKVREITNQDVVDEMTVIALADENLVAELILQPEMNVAQFGAKGDGTTDDQGAIEACLSYGASQINFIKGKTYMVRGYHTGDPEGSDATALTGQQGLTIASNTTVDLCNSTVKCFTNSRQNYNIFRVKNSENVTIRNGIVIGDVSTHTGTTGEFGYGLYIDNSSNVLVENMEFNECWADGISIWVNDTSSQQNKNITVRNCSCDKNRRQGLSAGATDGLYIYNSKFNNTGYIKNTAPSNGIDIEPGGGASDIVKNLVIDGCECINNYGGSVSLIGSNTPTTVNVDNVIISNNYFSNNQGNHGQYNLIVRNAKDCIIENNKFANEQSKIVLSPHNSIIFQNNYLTGLCTTQINPNYASNICFYIKDNTFDVSSYAAWTPVITITNSNKYGTYSGSKVLIDGNTIKHTHADEDGHRATFSCDAPTSLVSEVVISNNNIFGGGNLLTNLRIPLQLVNNTVRKNSTPISLGYNADYGTYIVNIKNNHFEQISYGSGYAGLINNNANVGLVLIGNTNFDHQIDKTYDIADPVNTPIRWLQNTVTASVNEDHENYIVHNS